jgi:hypothetical protein
MFVSLVLFCLSVMWCLGNTIINQQKIEQHGYSLQKTVIPGVSKELAPHASWITSVMTIQILFLLCFSLSIFLLFLWCCFVYLLCDVCFPGVVLSICNVMFVSLVLFCLSVMWCLFPWCNTRETTITLQIDKTTPE